MYCTRFPFFFKFKAELRYQGLFQVVSLTQNFFFSYSYDLSRSLQENFFSSTTKPFPPPPFKDMYAWNYFLTRELEGCLSTLTSYHWVMPIIHGAFVQRKLNDYGRSLNLILVARRSRHFAGTRYLKRGVSEQGTDDIGIFLLLPGSSTSSVSDVPSFCRLLATSTLSSSSFSLVVVPSLLDDPKRQSCQ